MLKFVVSTTGNTGYACVAEDESEVVGFTARTVGGSSTYNTDDVIQFNTVIANYGGYYNSETSIFICPDDGIYMFFCTILSGSTDTHAYITRNSDIEDLVSLDSNSISNSASNFVLTECLRGDKMWMRQGLDAKIVYGYLGTTFSGYLLHRSI